ncbi:uncharacterized protein [Branchiostoma lanceolatum]|uniref:uncharacterized protein n=1 Tax=Branchiostoma lanceolatum TaxID=7740 RepID=UPI0034553BDE
MAGSSYSEEDQALMEEVRDLIENTESELNILMVGRVGGGKSTLVNSAHMAVAQKWNEFAVSGKGAATNNTIYLTPIPMFERRYMKTPIDDYPETIKMWDFVGMENLEEESYITLIGLTLEGRVPEGTCVPELLKLKTQQLEKKFPTVDQKRRFHRVIMVCEADKDIPENLVKTVARSAKTYDGRQVPIFVLFSKMDRPVVPEEYAIRRQEALKAFQLEGNLERLFETSLYSDFNENCSRQRDKRFNRNEEIDSALLTMWRVLLNPAYNVTLRWSGRSYEEPPASWCHSQ